MMAAVSQIEIKENDPAPVNNDETKEEDKPQKEDVTVLFLDVDGVLNYSSMGYTKPLPLSDEHVKRIGVIVKETNCKIAFSTSWRLRKNSKNKLKEALRDIGDIDIDTVYFGSTPPPNILNKSLMKRSIEIRDFLEKKKSKYNILNYAIVDDLNLMEDCGKDKDLKSVIDGHFVMINGNTGITDADVKKVTECIQI